MITQSMFSFIVNKKLLTVNSAQDDLPGIGTTIADSIAKATGGIAMITVVYPDLEHPLGMPVCKTYGKCLPFILFY